MLGPVQQLRKKKNSGAEIRTRNADTEARIPSIALCGPQTSQDLSRYIEKITYAKMTWLILNR